MLLSFGKQQEILLIWWPKRIPHCLFFVQVKSLFGNIMNAYYLRVVLTAVLEILLSKNVSTVAGILRTPGIFIIPSFNVCSSQELT